MLSELNSWYSLDISLQSAYRSFRMLASETRPSRKFSTKNLLQGVTQTYQAIFHLLDTSQDESISARGGVKQNTPRPGQPGGPPPPPPSAFHHMVTSGPPPHQAFFQRARVLLLFRGRNIASSRRSTFTITFRR